MKRTKEELKQFFENGDKPTQEQFWDLIDSYFHRDEPIPLEELAQLKSNLATVDKTNDSVETLGNVDTKEQVNEKITAAINTLKANAPETYDTLKEIADYIANDSNAGVALLQLINTKLDKPTMSNNYYGLWDDTNKRLVDGSISDNGSNLIRAEKNFAIKFNSNQNTDLVLYSKYIGKGGYKGGIATFDENGEIVNEVISYLDPFMGTVIINNGMIINSEGENFSIIPFRSDSIKTNNLSFNLQESITPAPNTLVPKTDGNSLVWYNSSNVGNDVVTYHAPTNNKIARWSNGTFLDGSIIDNGKNIGIGVTPNDTTVSAQLNFKASDRKIMNIPKTNFLSSFTNNQPSQNQQLGDVYNNGDNIFWLRSNSNIDRWKKLTGFDVDYVCKLPQDFNSLKTTYSDTYNNANFDLLDKYGFANIWTADYCYGQKLTERFTSIANADSRMYEGVLTNINLGIFAYNGAVQQYQDIKGNLFLRGLGYAYTEQDWKKVITDNNNKSTTIGSEVNYPSAKLAIDSTNKGFLLPRMTKLQRNAIISPVQGLVIFQTDNGNSGIRVYDGANWQAIQTIID